ncbi:alpha-amylase [Mycena filopes]|nr:alpha-amylase [Mycena filopes]
MVHPLILALPVLSCIAAGSSASIPRHLRSRASRAPIARGPAAANNTIVQLFEWPWDSVAAECTSVLGAAGYGFVQVSPAAEHITGPQWFTDYQPVSYNVTSKRGNRDQFSSMVSTCASAGVGIIVDVVLNHMTGGPGGVGIAGSTFTKYNYPAIPYTESQFHYCVDGVNVTKNIADFNNATEVRLCELVGLSDLAQEQAGVSGPLVAYLNDLLSLGVAGFRIDAAKHMDPDVLHTMFSQLSRVTYITQEVSDGGESNPSQYIGNGDVIEFGATGATMAAFLGQGGQSISQLVTPTPLGTANGLIDSSVANFIMANQDTERSGGTTSLNSTSPNNSYILSAIFLLGFNYGTPTVFSGYDFPNFDAGAVQDATTGLTEAVTCGANGWRCEHRDIAIANMVGYHNAAVAAGAGLTNVVVGTTGQQIGFGRGSTGFVAINNDATAWSQTFTTSLPAGTYCDVIHDTDSDPATCTGATFTVAADGTFAGSVAPFDAIAIYSGSLTAAA